MKPAAAVENAMNVPDEAGRGTRSEIDRRPQQQRGVTPGDTNAEQSGEEKVEGGKGVRGKADGGRRCNQGGAGAAAETGQEPWDREHLLHLPPR